MNSDKLMIFVREVENGYVVELTAKGIVNVFKTADDVLDYVTNAMGLQDLDKPAVKPDNQLNLPFTK